MCSIYQILCRSNVLMTIWWFILATVFRHLFRDRVIAYTFNYFRNARESWISSFSTKIRWTMQEMEPATFGPMTRHVMFILSFASGTFLYSMFQTQIPVLFVRINNTPQCESRRAWPECWMQLILSGFTWGQRSSSGTNQCRSS